jgi:hypothetical protein
MEELEPGSLESLLAAAATPRNNLHSHQSSATIMEPSSALNGGGSRETQGGTQ